MFADELEMGSLVLDINTNRLDAVFLRDTGTIDDHFTIIKGGAAEPLRLATIKMGGGKVIARWKSKSGFTYRLESSRKPGKPRLATHQPQYRSGRRDHILDELANRRRGQGFLSRRPGGRLSGLASAEPARFSLGGLLAHLQLAKNGLEANEQPVPVGLDIAERVVIHLAQEANGRRGGNERMNFLAADWAAIESRRESVRVPA